MTIYSSAHVAIYNGGIRGTRRLMTHEPVLAHGVEVLKQSTGTESERLRLAIEAMAALCLLPESPIEYDRDLQGCTVPELKEIALRHDVELFGARRKDAIIQRLEIVRNLRNRDS